MDKIFGIAGTENWVTTKASVRIGMVNGSVNVYAAHKYDGYCYYGVQSIVVMSEKDTDETALIYKITKGLVKLDEWSTADWDYKVYNHPNAYGNMDGVQLVRRNIRACNLTLG